MTRRSLARALALAVVAAASLVAQARVVGTVVGHLRDPAPAARVWLERDGEVLARGFADGSGRFVFGNVPFGRVEVRATLPGHTVGFDSCSTSAAEPLAFVDLRVHAAGRVRGRVVDGDGAPVAGAFVLTENDVHFDWYIPEYTRHARSDAAGEFELEDVLLGPTVLRLWAPGKQLCELRLHVRGDERCDAVLRPADGAALRVLLAGASPEQTAAARVTIGCVRNGSGLSLPMGQGCPQLGLDGVVQVDGLPLDLEPRTVRIEVPGAAVEPGVVRLAIPSGADDRSREVAFRVVEQPQLEIRGHLRDAQGAPLAGCALFCARGWPLASATTRTADDGSWVLHTPGPVEGRLHFALVGEGLVLTDSVEHGFRGWSYVAAPFPDAVELVAVKPTVVRARVVDVEQRPIADLAVSLRVAGQRYGGVSAHCDADGGVEFTGLNGTDPQELQLVVEGRDGFGSSEPVHLESRPVVDLGRVVVQPAGSVAGVVEDSTGEPVPGARVSIRWCDPANGDQTGSGLIETVCDADGRFRFVGLTPRGWRLSVYPLGEERDDVAGPWFDLGVGEHASAKLSIVDGR